MKILETLILLLTFFPIQPDLKKEVEFVKAKQQDPFKQFERGQKEKKNVAIVVGDVVTKEDYDLNKDKYIFVFCPATELFQKHFGIQKGIILTKYDPHTLPTNIRFVSKHDTFPKAGCTSDCTCKNCKCETCRCANAPIQIYYQLKPSCTNGQCYQGR